LEVFTIRSASRIDEKGGVALSDFRDKLFEEDAG
jgi:hypothetical protein